MISYLQIVPAFMRDFFNLGFARLIYKDYQDLKFLFYKTPLSN